MELHWPHLYINCDHSHFSPVFLHQSKFEGLQLFCQLVQVFFFVKAGILTINQRYYLDVAFYAYIFANILVFLIIKGVYLFFAWVCCPAVYLKIKKIID